MLDTHAIARDLTRAGIPEQHADAITAAVRQAAQHDDHVTRAELRAELAGVEARLAWRLITAGIAVAGIQAATVIAALRLLP